MADGERRVEAEEAIIARFLAPLTAGFPGALALKDDCALLTPEPGHELVLKTDPLIEGVHFLSGDPPGAIAWKALAVNVSDLVAKGARPVCYLLALALPEAPTEAWLRAFADGLARAQTAFGCHLAGGDTDRTPGPLTVSVTVIGTLPAGRMVRRTTARPGDLVYVSGTIGDATLGLRLAREPALAARWGVDEAGAQALLARLRTPSPQLRLAEVVREHASASLDVSDGLAKDFDRLCRASGVGGLIETARVPLSGAARGVLARGGCSLADLLTGGEDYEVLLTLPADRQQAFEQAARARGLAVTCVGRMTEAGGTALLCDSAGQPLTLPSLGWDHFSR